MIKLEFHLCEGFNEHAWLILSAVDIHQLAHNAGLTTAGVFWSVTVGAPYDMYYPDAFGENIVDAKFLYAVIKVLHFVLHIISIVWSVIMEQTFIYFVHFFNELIFSFSLEWCSQIFDSQLHCSNIGW